MDADFWISKWEDKAIGFHRADYHPELIKYFDKIEPHSDNKILVPLCGKTKDMLFLKEKGLQISGIEFSDIACEEFFSENDLSFTTIEENGFKVFKGSNHSLFCGDFYKYKPEHKYQAAYDRAAIVAIDPKSRKAYAKQYSNLLVSGAKLLLLSFEYDQTKVQGPPWSVEETYINEFFGSDFKVEILDSNLVEITSPKFKKNGLEQATQKIYLLTRK